MVPPLLTILICLVLAYFLAETFRKIGLPRVVGEVMAGVLLGIGAIKPYLIGSESMKVIDFLANLGIILLFYYVGLQMNLGAFAKNVKRSTLISVFNTFLPFLLGFGLSRYVLGLDALPSLIVGVSLSVSAQSVSVDILEEIGMLKSRLGNMIVTEGAVDDVIEIVFITILLAVFQSSITGLTIPELIVDIALFAGVLVLARLLVIPYALRFFDREKSSTSRFTVSMIIVLLMAMFAEYLGMGILVGAIAAGMIVRQSIFKERALPNWEQHDIARSTHIMAFGFLIPFFFIKIGLHTNVGLIVPNIGMAALFTIIAIAGTIGGTILAVILTRGRFHEGMLLGWALSPKGDIELVLLALALEHGIIMQNLFTALIVTSLATTIISPIIFKKLVLRYRKKR